MYTAFAQVYDALMEADYAAWAQYYHELMKKTGVREKGKCVECACGTGGLTLPLKKLGWQITGLDLSEEMLARAMEKARAAGMIIPFVRQDMCALSVPGRVHCVLCTCDGVNYLTEPERVRQFFRAAFDALRPGGALIFDVSTPEKLQNTLGNNTLFADEEEISYIWQNAYDEKTACVDMALAIFAKRPDGAYDRLEETQTQRAHTMEELTQWLSQAGFEEIAFYGCQRMDAPRPGDDRWHVTARKPA